MTLYSQDKKDPYFVRAVIPAEARTVIEVIARKVLDQGPSTEERPSSFWGPDHLPFCVYNGPDGKHCAGAWLLSESDRERLPELIGDFEALVRYPRYEWLYAAIESTGLTFGEACALQRCHDTAVTNALTSEPAPSDDRNVTREGPLPALRLPQIKDTFQLEFVRLLKLNGLVPHSFQP
jgi:hypothetical protein